MSATRRFGIYPAASPGIPTAEDSYADGLRTGRAWSRTYRPGGPWVCTVGHGSTPAHPDWIAYCAATRENNREWLRGFDAGRAEARALPAAGEL